MTAMQIVPHRPRAARFARLITPGGWRIKLYGIATHREFARPALLDATAALAAQILPLPAIAADHYGVGFAIAHDATKASIALVYWWQSSNELHQRGFVGPLEPVSAMAPIPHQAAGCVWELGIIEFERQAWLRDVLCNPAGPDLDGYLARRLDADL